MSGAGFGEILSGATTTLVSGVDGVRRLTAPDGTRTIVRDAGHCVGYARPMPRRLPLPPPAGSRLHHHRAAQCRIGRTHQNASSVLRMTAKETVKTSAYFGATARGTVYDAATRTVTRESAEWRRTVATLDEAGRLVDLQIGLSNARAPIRFTYDGHGNLLQINQGDQTTTYGYDAQQRLLFERNALVADALMIMMQPTV